MDLLPGESRGYWKHNSPGKWFRQAKITGKIHNEKAILLLDTGAEVSILYNDKAKIVNVGQYLRIQAGAVELPLRLRSSIHDKLWVTRGDQWVPTISGGPRRTKYISITNIGDEMLILHQDQRIGIWLAGGHVPRIPGFILIGSRRCMEWQNLALEATTDTQSEEVEVENPPIPAVERPEYETPRTILQRPRTTLIQRQKVKASQDQDIPDCSLFDEAPPDKSPSDKSPSEIEESDLSSIADEDSTSHAVTVKEALEDLDQVTPDTWATNPLMEKITDMKRLREEDSQGEMEDVSLDQPHSRGQDQGISPSKCSGSDLPSMMSVQLGTGHVTRDPVSDKCTTSMSQKMDVDPSPVGEDQPGTLDLDLTWDSDQDYDECVYYHEGSDLYAEDVDGQMAVLPEVPVATEDVRIEDIQLCGSGNQTPEEIERLHQRIWKFRHLLIVKGNALPPAARGV
ncbi:LOW QUALITY PROTEIN: hypothetical protein PHMEG_00034486, partial [Phytophthora megakarya]